MSSWWVLLLVLLSGKPHHLGNKFLEKTKTSVIFMDADVVQDVGARVERVASLKTGELEQRLSMFLSVCV